MNKIHLVLTSLLLASCISNQGAELTARNPAQYEKGSTAHNLTFDGFIRTLKNSEAKTVEEALAALSRQYPKYMKFHTLVYDSFSLHQSTYTEPRVLIFGPLADFIVTFNGGTHMRGGNAFEVMQYKKETGVFEFREIAFKEPNKKEAPEMLTAADIEFENAQMKYTKANPNKCSVCHTQSARPIWETYFIWPGTYGSNDDILTTLFHKKEVKQTAGNYNTLKDKGRPGVSIGRFVQLKNGFADNEFIGFKKFMAGKPTHPRYKYLPDRAIDTGFSRLNAGENMDSIDTTAAVEKEADELNLSYTERYLHPRPNLDLNTRLYMLTMNSFVTRTLANPKTKSLSFKIAWLNECDMLKFDPRIIQNKTHLGNETEDPLKELSSIISNSEADQIRKTAGPWKEFYRSFISKELDMEVAKLQRLERTFGENSIEVSQSYLGHQELYRKEGRDSEYYAALKGRPLNRLETIASYDESDDFLREARAAYIARGFGVDMSSFSTNFNRFPTLREGGYKSVTNELRDRGLIDKAPAGHDPNYASKVTCPQLAQKSLEQ